MAAAPSALAQATRTWISGVGDDVNPCSRTAPCKTWAGAISKTAVGGEIDALDPGGFGAVTITKAITLDGGGGQEASILVSGTNGVVIQAPATAKVVLRNLRINGISQSTGPGLNGVRFLAGKSLRLENDDIFDFSQQCLDVALNQTGTSYVTVDNSEFYNCAGDGVKVAQSNSGGSAIATITRSQISDGGLGLVTANSGGGAEINSIDDTISNNAGAGVQSNGPLDPQIMSGDTITGNTPGIQNLTGGAIFTFGNNDVFANTPNLATGTTLTTVNPQSGDVSAGVAKRIRARERARRLARERARRRAAAWARAHRHR
jgi:hypothetical protein